MKRITDKIQIIILFVFGMVLFGCNNWLEEEIFSEKSPVNVYKTAQDADAAVIAVYNVFLEPTMFPVDLMNFTFMSSPHSLTYVPYRREFADYTYSIDNVSFDRFWASSYRAINRANAAIGRIPQIEMDETKKTELIAEAKVLRAYHYFNVVRLFRGVKLYLTESTGLGEIETETTPTSEVYNAIIQDLQEASAELPKLRAGNEKGRVTQGTAKFLLAKVYLTMSGKPLNDPSHLSEGKDLLTELIANRQEYGYGLESDFMSIFSLNNELNEEIVLAAQFTSKAPGYGTSIPYYMSPVFSKFANTAIGGEYDMGCSLEFYESYEDNDSRKQSWVWSYIERNTGETITFGAHPYPWGNEKTGVASAKYQDEDGGIGSADNDLPIYRFADAYLMLAEIENELNGPTLLAYNNLNVIRSRALASAFDPASGLSKDQFREIIYHERFLEFSCEFHEIFDIRRFGKVKESIEANYWAQRAGTVYREDFELYPVPLMDRQK